jgi:hypothetical protein
MPPSTNIQSLPKGFKFGAVPEGGVKQDGSGSPVRRRMELKVWNKTVDLDRVVD